MKTVRTWWGKRFIEALEGFIDAGRLARGRGYANESRILQWRIQGGRIEAQIRGNINPYFGVHKEPLYNTVIEFKPIGASDWAEAIAQIGTQAGFVSRLLLNEVPDNIEDPFEALGLNLLPQSMNDMQTQCSCPDWANPCKHVAGLNYFLAGRLDQDPFLLFELRGLARGALLQQLRATSLGRILAQALSEEEAPVHIAESCFTRPIPQEPQAPEDFWHAKKRLPEQIEPAMPPAVPALLIKKGGDFPAFWERENSFIAAMEGVYEAVRKRAKTW
jgi:uncharacterized Zn finger protein